MAMHSTALAVLAVQALARCIIAAGTGPIGGNSDQSQGLPVALRACYDQVPPPNDSTYVNCLQRIALEIRGFGADLAPQTATAAAASSTMQSGILQVRNGS